MRFARGGARGIAVAGGGLCWTGMERPASPLDWCTLAIDDAGWRPAGAQTAENGGAAPNANDGPWRSKLVCCTSFVRGRQLGGGKSDVYQKPISSLSPDLSKSMEARADPRASNVNEAGMAAVMFANTGASRGTGRTAATATQLFHGEL